MAAESGLKGIAPRRPEQGWIVLAILLLALLARLPHLFDSLWYDELYTLVHYVLQPWQVVLAPRVGEYVPNDHVLHTVLAKLVYSLGPGGEAAGLGPNEALLRAPALVAGVLLPVALWWGLRRREPVAAAVLGLVAAVHPWLVTFSDEARGYSLLLLLGVVATNLLPQRQRPWGWRRGAGYALAMGAAIYTVPIAVMLFAGHAAAAVAARRARVWAVGVAGAVLLAGLLYAPMAPALLAYYRHPVPATGTHLQMLDDLPRLALFGQRVPPRPAMQFTPAAPVAINVACFLVPVLVLVVGSILAWQWAGMRVLLLSMGGATVAGLLLPFLLPAASEPRFVPWAAVWMCAGLAGIVLWLWRHARTAGVVAGVALLVWMGWRDVTMPADQPIRDGMRLADKLAPPGRALLIGYIGGIETAYVYGPQESRPVLFGPDASTWRAAEAQARRETGSDPWVLIFFEPLLRDSQSVEQGNLWEHLMQHYRLVKRLPGRLTPVSIYAPR